MLQPFQELLQRYPQWLREQVQSSENCPVRAQLLERLPGLPCTSASADALSSRERAVLELIAQGWSNQQISERLFISLHTVKTHASHINSKLGSSAAPKPWPGPRRLACWSESGRACGG